MILAVGEIQGSVALAVAYDVPGVHTNGGGLFGTKYRNLSKGDGCMMMER